MYNTDTLCIADSLGWFVESLNNRIANWRKPVPFWINEDANKCDVDYLMHEPFDDEASYRYLAEFISYYVGYFGNGDAMPDYYNYNESVNLGAEVVGNKWNSYIEIWNEPDSWWVKPNDYGYFKPNELAKLCEAVIGNSTIVNLYSQHQNKGECNQELDSDDHNCLTILEDYFSNMTTNPNLNECMTTIAVFCPNRELTEDCVQNLLNPIKIDTVGLNPSDGMQVVSPAPHEMDVQYMKELIQSIRTETNLGSDFNFDVYAFHHYSAYDAFTLESIQDDLLAADTTSVGNCTNGILSPDNISTYSVLNRTKMHAYDIKPMDSIVTVTLEAEPANPNAYWICPELDGYLERGLKLDISLSSLIDSTPIWITEWGYPSEVVADAAKYPSGLEAEETQARWLMRGFIEYDRSPHIEASFWHWLQNVDSGTWDTSTGILDQNDSRKTSWYYIHTLINEIGEKGFFESVAYGDGTTECELDIVPSVVINDNILTPQLPCMDCPKIYKYTDQCCEETLVSGVSARENYAETVWTIWFPYMLDYKNGQMKFFLDTDLGVDGEPLQYYTVTPVNGSPNGMVSDFLDISYDPLNQDRPYIVLEISEKPIFVHFIGECICGNDDPSIDPGGGNCTIDDDVLNITKTCTSISIHFGIELPSSGCGISADDLTITSVDLGGVSGTGNTGFEVDFIDVDEASFTYTGLNPGEEYNFSVGIGYSVGGEFGFEVISFPESTNEIESCFTDLVVDSVFVNVDSINCNSAGFDLYFGADPRSDVSILTLTSTLTQLEAGGSCADGPGDTSYPLPEVPAFDWLETSPGVYKVANTIMDQLSPNQCYCISYQVLDENGNIYLEHSEYFCTQSCPNLIDPPILISANCDGICFSPTRVHPDSCIITEYRWELTDQEGNTASDFIDFKNFAASCDEEELCFNGNRFKQQFDQLGTPPYVGFIRAIRSDMQPNINTPLFSFDCCQASDFPSGQFSNCKVKSAYFKFCLNDLEDCMSKEITKKNVSVETSALSYKIFGPDISKAFIGGTNCFGVQFNKENLCADLTYKITFESVDNFGEPFILVFEGVFDHSDCICLTGPNDPQEPTVFSEYLDLETINEQTNPIYVNGRLDQLQTIAAESRRNGLPVSIVLDEKSANIVSETNFIDQVNLSIPEAIYQPNRLNKKYNIHLLANGSVYNILLPELVLERNANRNSILENETNVVVYPNPSHSSFVVESKSTDISSVTITDIHGREILKKNMTSTQLDFDSSNLISGLYFIHIKLVGHDTFIIKKLIVE